jgi:hypothetical protein
LGLVIVSGSGEDVRKRIYSPGSEGRDGCIDRDYLPLPRAFPQVVHMWGVVAERMWM